FRAFAALLQKLLRWSSSSSGAPWNLTFYEAFSSFL
ncbi:MAG: hypothetical protein ACI9IV_000199, partial [Paracoccaceae bacterium]